MQSSRIDEAGADNCYRQPRLSTNGLLQYSSKLLRGRLQSRVDGPPTKCFLFPVSRSARPRGDCVAPESEGFFLMILNLWHFYELISRNNRAALMNT